MAAIGDNVWAVLILVLLFGITIFVHELGHYLAARWCGLVVDVFSIGFGPALWKRKHGGVVYRIGCIPVGGYVALPQLDPTAMSAVQTGGDKAGVPRESGEAAQRSLPRVAAWRKVVVSLAGATGNILFAVLTAWLVYWIGVPAGPAERSTVVGYVDPKCKAYELGLRIGDEIRAVNGLPVHKWSEFRVESALSRDVKLLIKAADGAVRVIELPTERGILGEQMVAGVDGRDLCSVLSVTAGMAAEKAGLTNGDTIVEFAGQPVFSRAHLIELVNESKDRPTALKFKRVTAGREETVATTVTPAFDPGTGQVRIGIQFNMAAVEHDTVAHPTPREQLREDASAIFRFLRALVTPREAKAASRAVGGPVAIAASYWLIVKTSLMLAIRFTVLLNVNLGIINLLPIPVLDGGHIMFSLWEMITRRPVHARVINALVNFFAVLLIGLMLLLSVRDLDRFTPAGRYLARVFGGSTNRPEAVVAVPASTNGTGGAVTNR